MHSIKGISYEMRCGNCSNVTQRTTAELERMVNRGEATSPAGQMREFKCGHCGQLKLIMTAGVPHVPQ